MSHARRDEVEEKLARLRHWMQNAGVDGTAFAAQSHVSWVTAGAQNIIERNLDPALVRAFVTQDRAVLVTQNIEAPRIEREESAADLGFEVLTFPWYEAAWDGVMSSLGANTIANDGWGPGRAASEELRALRLALTSGERSRLTTLANDATKALESTLRSLHPGVSGRGVAASFSERLEQAGIVPIVLLVGGDERKLEFRHPTVNEERIHESLICVLVGHRSGLHVSLTRSLSFGPLSPEMARRHHIAASVETAMMQATRPGATYGDALQAGIDAYARHGFEGEWKNHYQGGGGGYHIREVSPAPPGTPNRDSSVPIALHHFAAWNPTVEGTKSEDTFLVSSDGPCVLTTSGDWPTLAVEVAGMTTMRPAVLELS